MRVQEAFRRLEKIGIERAEKLEALKMDRAKARQALHNLVAKYDAVYFDDTVPAQEVAAQKIEVDRAKRRHDKAAAAVSDMEAFGSVPQIADFQPLYNEGMAAILSEMEKIDLEDCIKTVRAAKERLDKCTAQIHEYHSKIQAATGSGSRELAGLSPLEPVTAKTLARLDDALAAINAVQSEYNLRMAAFKQSGLCSDWSGFAADHGPMPEDVTELKMFEDYSPEFKKGDTVFLHMGRSVTRANGVTRYLTFNEKGLSAWIPFITVCGREYSVR